MKFWRRLTSSIPNSHKEGGLLGIMGGFEGLVSIVLSLTMMLVIIVAVYELVIFIFTDLFITEPVGRFTITLARIFGLFLNVLIAMELLENITAYLKKHVIQVELVIITSLIAVSRKIIILDLEKTQGVDLIALGTAILALSISYWIIRRVHRRDENSDRH